MRVGGHLLRLEEGERVRAGVQGGRELIKLRLEDLSG